MADEKKQFQKRGSNFGRNNSQFRMNRHASGTKALIKEESELDDLLSELIGAHEKGEPPWKLLFNKFGSYYDERFGKDWKEKNKDFWTEFEKS